MFPGHGESLLQWPECTNEFAVPHCSMCMAVGVRMQGIMLLNVILPHARSPKPEQQDVVEGSAVFSLVLISSFNVFHCDKT